MTIDEFNPDEQFRDSIATVDKDGKRIWVYPKKPKGKFYNYRTYLTWFYLIVLFGLPFIKVNGEPFILFNIPERNFILFSFHFGPQDFYLFVIAMLIFVVFIILFTVVFGRLFCGWVCPQTIFMEMVFRKIEYWIEGDANAQRKLDNQEWNQKKIFKKAGKHLIFFGISILIANTFLAYIIGLDEVILIISEPISMHLTGFIAMIIFSFIFYGVFAKMREQVCIAICPYGRLQGVLLDNKSLVVAYDFVRGEPRSKIKKNKDQVLTVQTQTSAVTSENETAYTDQFRLKAGDCIDCSLCVQVCPTGIDIRHGTQLECVNCTACMDACDEVMEKIDRPLGLIRIDSIEGIEKRSTKIFNPRVLAYSAVLILLLAVEVLLFSLRSDVEVLILRTPGMLFQTQEDGRISNLYNYQMINKTSENYIVEFRLLNINGTVEVVGEQKPEVRKNGKSEGALFIKISKNDLKSRSNDIEVGVFAGDKMIEKVKTSFFGPVQ
ncbi:MAG: cytochrome c oxidase accessory protein CcoG [Saprospiraceae bacterium]|nr:cytochrome c oxidase accessory protein CcoG [Saprospiraceae bacterium]